MYIALNDNVPERSLLHTDLTVVQDAVWEDCGPNVIVASNGDAWVRGAYPNRAAQWFKTSVKSIAANAACENDSRRALTLVRAIALLPEFHLRAE